jgi:hypothetical protein
MEMEVEHARHAREADTPEKLIPEIPGVIAEWGDAPDVVYADELPDGPEKDKILAALAERHGAIGCAA